MSGRTSGADAGRDADRRPAWEVLDAARAGGFTGALGFGSDPVTDVYLERGEIYLAECHGDPELGVRLVAVGALTLEELDQGTVEVQGERHLGRLFDRVPTLDRAAVLAALESLTDETVVWIAAQTPQWAVARPYVRHASGVDRWYAVSPPPARRLPAPLPVLDDRGSVLRGWRLPPDDATADPERSADAVRTHRPSRDEVRIDWLDDAAEHSPVEPASEFEDRAGFGDRDGFEDRGAFEDRVGFGAGGGSDDIDDLDDLDDLAEFVVMWPSGETATPRPVPPPPGAEWSVAGALLEDVGSVVPPLSATGSNGSDRAAPGLRTPPTAPPVSATPTAAGTPGVFPPPVAPGSAGAGTSPDTATVVSDQMRLAIRRTIAAIEDGMLTNPAPAPARATHDAPGVTRHQDPADDDPWRTEPTYAPTAPVLDPPTHPMDPIEDPFAEWGIDEGARTTPGPGRASVTGWPGTGPVERDEVRRGRLVTPPDPAADDERRHALRRLIDSLRGR